MEGKDYRGVTVVAALRAVPDSPWFLVARMDKDELYGPLRLRLWEMTGLVGALVLVSGGIFAFILKNQKFNFERKQIASAIALEKSEKTLKAIFENVKDGILGVDAQTLSIVIANPEICRMLGYTHEEMFGLSLEDIHPASELPHIKEWIAEFAKNRKFPARDIRMKRRDGSEFFTDSTTVKLTLDGRDLLITVFRDITQRKEAEFRIEHLNTVLLAIRSVNKLIVRADDTEELVEKACSLLVEHRGYHGAFIILTNESGRPVFHAQEGDGKELLSFLRDMDHCELPPCCEAAKTSEGVISFSDRGQICATCPAADSVLSGSTMSIRLQHLGRVYGYMWVRGNSDMAGDEEERSVFAELAGDLAYSLHNIVVQRAMAAAELEQKKLEAQLFQAQKMEAVGRLAGGVAHDFNNLLSIIIGYGDMLLEDLPPDDPHREAINEIGEAAIRARDLTRQLLAFSRKQMLEVRVVDVNRVIADFEKLLQRTIGEDIALEFMPTREAALVKVDVSQLEQILMNLAVNARDAMPDGGLLTIETACVELDASYASRKPDVVPGRYVMICVSDNGTGMDKETMDRIFEPFFTTKPKDKGTGLGLSTIYGVVKQHGGNIWVYSEPGHGTSFKIYLPASKGSVENKHVETAVSQPLMGAVTILVAEDEPALRKLSCGILERQGYRVLEAGDAQEAVDIASRYGEPIHLLLTDVVMPGMKGTEVYQKVAEAHPGIKVLYMSGYTENVIARQGILKEGVNFIQKPFSLKTLQEKVGKLIGT